MKRVGGSKHDQSEKIVTPVAAVPMNKNSTKVFQKKGDSSPSHDGTLKKANATKLGSQKPAAEQLKKANTIELDSQKPASESLKKASSTESGSKMPAAKQFKKANTTELDPQKPAPERLKKASSTEFGSKMPAAEQQSSDTGNTKLLKKPEGATHQKCAKNTLVKPGRPLTAFNLFFRYRRREILQSTHRSHQAEGNLTSTGDSSPPMLNYRYTKTGKRLHRKTHGLISFVDLVKIVSAQWKKLGPAARAPFESQAKIEKEMYEIKVSKYKQMVSTDPQLIVQKRVRKSAKSKFKPSSTDSIPDVSPQSSLQSNEKVQAQVVSPDRSVHSPSSSDHSICNAMNHMGVGKKDSNMSESHEKWTMDACQENVQEAELTKDVSNDSNVTHDKIFSSAHSVSMVSPPQGIPEQTAWLHSRSVNNYIPFAVPDVPQELHGCTIHAFQRNGTEISNVQRGHGFNTQAAWAHGQNTGWFPMQWAGLRGENNPGNSSQGAAHSMMHHRPYGRAEILERLTDMDPVPLGREDIRTHGHGQSYAHSHARYGTYHYYHRAGSVPYPSTRGGVPPPPPRPSSPPPLPRADMAITNNTVHPSLHDRELLEYLIGMKEPVCHLDEKNSEVPK